METKLLQPEKAYSKSMTFSNAPKVSLGTDFRIVLPEKAALIEVNPNLPHCFTSIIE